MEPFLKEKEKNFEGLEIHVLRMCMVGLCTYPSRSASAGLGATRHRAQSASSSSLAIAPTIRYNNHPYVGRSSRPTR